MRRKKTKIIVLADPKKGSVTGALKKFSDFVKGKADIAHSCNIKDCRAEIVKGCDFAIVLGGDGSIISAARFLSEKNIPVIGVNLGKLGFLAEFSIEELLKYFDDVISKKVKIEKRLILNCTLINNGKEIFTAKAVNDLFINAGAPFRMIELQIKVNGQPLAGCVGDGLIISTPTGSTAYNLSSGGPILSAKMDAHVITPICPHSLSFRPIVISSDCKIEVVGLKVNKGTNFSIDGQLSKKLTSDDIITIKKDKSSFLVVNNPERNQWDTLAAKLGWAEKPKYSITGFKPVATAKSCNNPEKIRPKL